MLDVDYWQATIMWCEPWQGGAKIKEIRESSGANIKAYQSCAPQVSAMIMKMLTKTIAKEVQTTLGLPLTF